MFSGIVEETAQVVAIEHDKDNIHITMKCSFVDELKIEKVVDNLISNAIKYSHTNGRVELTLNCNEYYWSLEVRDYGLGISDNAQKKLFKEFYREELRFNA